MITNSKQCKKTNRRTVFSFTGNNGYTIANDGADTTNTTYTTSVMVTCTCPTGLL